MKVIIENTEFPYDEGVRILKLKYEECPVESIRDIWSDIKPLSFKEIAAIKNIEERRIAFTALGIDRLVKEINPVLIDEQVIEKTSVYIDKDNQLVERKFCDKYQLFRVDAKYFTNDSDPKDGWRKATDAYYVKCKDTSTDRNYHIWIEPRGVYEANHKTSLSRSGVLPITAIQAIAWTMTTNIAEGGIESIIRQGDCILYKTKPDFEYVNPRELRRARHLTEKEYRELLTIES